MLAKDVHYNIDFLHTEDNNLCNLELLVASDEVI